MTARRQPSILLACDFFVRYSARLAAGMEGAGADVALLTRDHDLEFGGDPGAAAEFVAAATGGRVAHHALAGRVRSPRGLAAAMPLRGAVREAAPDVVHVQESITNDVRLLLVAGVRPGRFAMTFHDPSPHPGDAVSRRDVVANRLLARRAGLLFVHGEALRDELIANVRPRAPIVVVPHGIDPAAAAPLPERPNVLLFGRMSRYKGLGLLLDAMADVWRRVPNATVTVAGAGEIEPHPSLADRRVTVRAGHVPDAEVPELLATATCVALPYRQASQSGVGSLVKPHGRPLVATAVGGLPELLADGSGLLVPPEDPARLAAALTSVLTDRALAERLGAAGVRTAEREAGWDRVAELTLTAYREHLLSGRQA
ncbi:MAG: glycosyltransferase family 4 protein [Thermoleophilaceae bacterium]